VDSWQPYTAYRLSSVGQSTSLVMKGSGVRIPKAAPGQRPFRGDPGGPFAWAYSSEIQLRVLTVEAGVELIESPLRLGAGDLGVNVHGHRDLRVPQDAHGDARARAVGGQHRGAGVAGVVVAAPWQGAPSRGRIAGTGEA